MTNSDLTFITNEGGRSLKDRFSVLIEDTQFFDVLVGYFYTSGFYAIYPSLEKTEKIRILIGISTNKQTHDLIQRVQSHKEIGENYGEKVKEEMEQSENNYSVEEGVQKFLKWLKSGKLEIKAYPEEKIHSKLYIMTFNEDDRDTGRVITGSSNLTQSGLVDNLEFNVELKNPSDHEYAKNKFENLWDKGVDVSEQYIETIQRDTWLREDITPYELYLKFLYEYFKEEINEEQELEGHYRPNNFKKLKYQDDAVLNAKKIINEYGGVFLSDVVGLGKTYMGTMLAQELNEKILVLAPPHLIDEENAGSWENAFKGFGFRSRDYKCESIGKLDSLIQKETYKDFAVILIDEAHRFRTEETETYEKLAQICHGKKVILVTATPYNNSPMDLLAQIKLFQRTRESTLPNLPDIEGFFKGLIKRVSKLDRRKDKKEYIETVKENSRLIRERVLKYLMVRRTRGEIEKNYEQDLKDQGMEFPTVAKPRPIYYEFNEEEDRIFFKTLELAVNDFKYARYTAISYHEGATAQEKQRQTGMMKFMKMLLVKRLESSFFAFKKTLNRFIISYERFLTEFDNGSVFVSAKHTNKIFEFLEVGDLQAIDRLLEDGKAEKYPIEEFDENLRKDVEQDLIILRQMKDLWKNLKRDPKLVAFKEKLAQEKVVIEGKSIIFTESQETAEYLTEKLQDVFPNQVICFSGAKSHEIREEVLANFDANAKRPKDDYKILITTDVLSEGANLHRSNVVINYDIPWNPTRVMQRVGRINRVDTKHKEIFTYTFFPTDQANEQIKLQECAEVKIAAFISLLGADAKLLTENEEPESHTLFNKIMSMEAVTGEDEAVESELSYLLEIRKIRNEQPALFEKIKRLPKKARTARFADKEKPSLLTYFRNGKLQKFFLSDQSDTHELDFMEAAKTFVAPLKEKTSKFDKIFYDLLKNNLTALQERDIFEEEISEQSRRGSRDNAARLSKILSSREVQKFQGYTEDDEVYLERILAEINAGGVPKKSLKKAYNEISEKAENCLANPIKLLGILKKNISSDFLNPTHTDTKKGQHTKKEIILSEYFNSSTK